MKATKNLVEWFEIPVTDLVRARKFYEALLNVEMKPEDMGPMKMVLFPMVKDGAGAAGALVKSEGYTPTLTGAVVYFTVESIDDTLLKAKALGGTVLLPKMGIGEYGFMAHFEDSEGNRIALWSLK
jgi:predicted enzyme related to lactoylglutathione lyase